jgi:orotidine-5'-phosphate decarboxylase
MKDRLIIALDLPDGARALEMARTLKGQAGWVKVGMTLYYAEGPQIVRELRAMGFKVFVDLKLHDIPHQVGGACRTLTRVGADLFTVHASGGRAMLEAAVAATAAAAEKFRIPRPRVIAVTVLTSLDAAELGRLGVLGTPREAVLRLAELSLECGADGLVASAQEVGILRERFGPSPLLVVPGMRDKPSSDDQKRVGKVEEASGADYFVVGRPIIHAPSPGDEARRWAARISNVVAKKG